MNNSDPIPSASTSPGTYTPGRAWRKLMMVPVGFLLIVIGITQLWQPLRLMAFGKKTRAEAVSVIKTKPGLPDQILTDDVQITARLEPHDRSYIFWNEFSFRTADDKVENVRAPVGSQLKPLYPLLDPDGLPTTDLVYYDPAHPNTVVFPLIISTWFAPGVLVIIGLIYIIIGSVLFYWARKPIELPHIPGPFSGKA